MKAVIENNTCKLLTKVNRTYYKNVAWVQPVLTANGTMGGNKFACGQSASYNSTTIAFRCFNGNTTTIAETNRWQVNNVDANTEVFIYWYNPSPLKITNLKVWNSEASYTIKNYVLYGSNDGSAWEAIKSGTNTNYNAASAWNIAVNTSKDFKYFRLGCKPNNVHILVAEIQITATELKIVDGFTSDYDFYEDKLIYYGIGD
jgi:hypothetical protein